MFFNDKTWICFKKMCFLCFSYIPRIVVYIAHRRLFRKCDGVSMRLRVCRTGLPVSSRLCQAAMQPVAWWMAVFFGAEVGLPRDLKVQQARQCYDNEVHWSSMKCLMFGAHWAPVSSYIVCTYFRCLFFASQQALMFQVDMVNWCKLPGSDKQHKSIKPQTPTIWNDTFWISFWCLGLQILAKSLGFGDQWAKRKNWTARPDLVGSFLETSAAPCSRARAAQKDLRVPSVTIWWRMRRLNWQLPDLERSGASGSRPIWRTQSTVFQRAKGGFFRWARLLSSK